MGNFVIVTFILSIKKSKIKLACVQTLLANAKES